MLSVLRDTDNLTLTLSLTHTQKKNEYDNKYYNVDILFSQNENIKQNITGTKKKKI